MSAYVRRGLWWHMAIIGKTGAVSRDTNMSMRRWGRRGVVLTVRRRCVLWLALCVERRGRRRPPGSIVVDLWCSDSSSVFMNTSIVDWCQRSWCCRGISLSDRTLSERLGLFRGGVVWGLCVGLERFSKGLGFGGVALGRRVVCLGHRTRRSADRVEIIWKHLDEVGWKQADRPPVPPQPARPPRSVASIETFYQVAFYEAQVSL